MTNVTKSLKLKNKQKKVPFYTFINYILWFKKNNTIPSSIMTKKAKLSISFKKVHDTYFGRTALIVTALAVAKASARLKLETKGNQDWNNSLYLLNKTSFSKIHTTSPLSIHNSVVSSIRLYKTQSS